MRLQSIRARALHIPFRASFAHASASRSATQSMWVEAQDERGAAGYGESCPREYVTGETLQASLAFVARYEQDWLDRIDGLPALQSWVAQHAAEIDREPAAWAAVELALLDLLARQAGLSVEQMLGLPALQAVFHYTAVVGDAPVQAFEAVLTRYLRAGFRDFKIKLSGDLRRDREKIRALRAAGVEPMRARADANNLWRDADAAVACLNDLDYPFVAVEEPLQAGDYRGMQRVADRCGCSIILDESLTRVDQLRQLPASVPWVVNLRISKMGGLLRSLAVAEYIRRAGLRMVVGAHVGETSLLTRAALPIANAYRDVLLAQEGAFGTHLLERDPVAPVVMFGPGGVLNAADVPAGAGWGLGPAQA
jgi:L-alanine-DL-glutamate epimerase-like enolase superfamily enzyme